jgi:hypothetical protein
MTRPDTEPSAGAVDAARALIGKHWRVKGYRVQGDFELMEREAALALDRFRAAGVREERERCLRVLKLNNDNDAHRYYIEHPEFFK